DLAREVVRGAMDGAARNDTVCQPPRERLLGANRAAGENHVESTTVADQAWESDGTAVDEWNPPAAAEHAELCRLVHDAQIAPQRELEAAGDGVPVHCGDHRLLEKRPAHTKRSLAFGLVGQAVLGEGLQVVAGAEAAARAAQD